MFAEEIQQIQQIQPSLSNPSLSLNLTENFASQNWSFDLPESGPDAKRRKINDGEHLRCPNYTDEENFLIAHLFKEHQEILRDHRNTTKINRLKNAIWQLIADTISSRPGATTRTAEQVRRRWKTMLGQERSLEAILDKYQAAILNKDTKKQQSSTGTSTPSNDPKIETSLDGLFPPDNDWLNNALKSNLDNFLAMLSSLNNNGNSNDDNQSSINDENEEDPEASSSGAIKQVVNTNAPSKHARTLEVKKAVIEAAEQNNNKSELAKQFNMPRSTIRDILVNKEAILRAIDRGGDVTRARLTPGKHNHLEEELLSWIKNAQSQNILITGTLIKEKAKELGALLKIEGFQASNGWLENFKKRNSVTLRSNQGEVTDVNTELLNDWPQQVLHDAFAEYSLDGVFNEDETESQDPEDINDITNDANSLSSQSSKQPNFTVEILAGDSLNDQILNKQEQVLNTSQNGSVNGEEANRTIEMNTRNNTPNNTNDPTAAIKHLMNQQNLKQSYYSLALKAEKDLREARQKAEEEKIRREEELFNLQIEKERAQIRLYDSQRELAEAQTYLIKFKTKMLEDNMNQDLKSQDQILPNHEDDTLE